VGGAASDEDVPDVLPDDRHGLKRGATPRGALVPNVATKNCPGCAAEPGQRGTGTRRRSAESAVGARRESVAGR
jgi:hypothetical protein